MRLVILLLMLISLSAAAQKQKYNIDAYSESDTVHIETIGSDLVLEWKDGNVDMYPYTIGVYQYLYYDMICFDEYDIARYAMISYKDKKHEEVEFIYLQYNNGNGIEFRPVKKKKNGKR